MIDLWTEASTDYEAELEAARLTRAKVAVASLWPFLSSAKGPREFEHRLALAADRIAERAGIELFDPVVASLREDFRVVAAEDAEGESEASEDSDTGKPDWLTDKIKGKESGLQFFHAGLGRWVALGFATNPADASTRPEEPPAAGMAAPGGAPAGSMAGGPSTGSNVPQGPEQEAAAASATRETNPAPMPPDRSSSRSITGPGGVRTGSLQYFNAGLGRWVAVEDDATAGKGNPYYFTGGPEGGPNTGQTNQFPAHPTGQDPWSPINDMYPMQPTPWTGGVEWTETPMNFDPPGGPNQQRAASRLPFTGADRAEVGDTDTCANCANPMKKISTSWGEVWTHTGRHGAEADDNCPGVPESTMRTAVQHAATNGVPNPHYFDGGPEGVQGDDTFPEDEAQGVDPTDERVDWYQNPMQPLAHLAANETVENPGPDSDKLLGTEFPSPQEAERWRKAQAGDFHGRRDIHSVGTLYDPYDATIRSIALGGQENNPGAQDGAGAGAPTGEVPQPPPSMTGGPGSVAQKPLTTAPRQMPGGGGGQPPGQGGEAQMAGQDPMAAQASRHHALGDSRDIPTAEDPTGLGDEYREKTVNGPLSTRPRQPMEHRNPNTPQGRREPIPTNSSSDAEGREEENERDEQDDEQDGRRRASRVASRAIRELVGV